MIENKQKRCIFCKKNSDADVSMEHIIPESLGNTTLILAPGIVCDKCNNYFSNKVEGKLLKTQYFRLLRSEQNLISKRGRPAQIPVLTASKHRIFHAAISDDRELNSLIVTIPNQNEWGVFIKDIENESVNTIIIPVCPKEPPDNVMGRFLAKIAFEALADRLSSSEELLNQMIDEVQFDLIRDYARYAKGPKNWPYSQRVVYDRNRTNAGEDGHYQTIYETRFIIIDDYLFFVFILFGVEYAINLTHPEVKSYEKWLILN